MGGKSKQRPEGEFQFSIREGGFDTPADGCLFYLSA